MKKIIIQARTTATKKINLLYLLTLSFLYRDVESVLKKAIDNYSNFAYLAKIHKKKLPDPTEIPKKVFDLGAKPEEVDFYVFIALSLYPEHFDFSQKIYFLERQSVQRSHLLKEHLLHLPVTFFEYDHFMYTLGNTFDKNVDEVLAHHRKRLRWPIS